MANAPARLYPHVVLALVLYNLDAFVLAQGFFGSLAALVGVVYGLAVGLGASRSVPGARARGLGIAATYGLMVVLLIGTIMTNNSIAKHRAADVVTALEQYKTRHGAYPARLEDLVPAELPDGVPRAKYVLTLGHFDYHFDPRSEDGFLMYVVFPPFGRRTYNLKTARWGFID